MNPYNKTEKLITSLTQKIAEQLQCILHHPQFQALEATWRNLYVLSHPLPSPQTHIKLKIVAFSHRELVRDFEKASDIEQTILFQKIHEQEWNQIGGEPFSVLLGDYYFSNSTEDIQALGSISKITASSFLPFLTSLSPHFFNLSHFSDLSKIELPQQFKSQAYARWEALRTQKETQFLNLFISRVILRKPHSYHHQTGYLEKISEKEDYLWGNPIYYYAAFLIQHFSHTHWFSFKFNSHYVIKPQADSFYIENPFLSEKYISEIRLDKKTEKFLFEQGITLLKECSYKATFTFTPARSLHKDSHILLYTLLCFSRFAHHIKQIARDKIGCFKTPLECEHCLQAWLHHYTADIHQAEEEIKAKYPLKKSNIKIDFLPGETKKYVCNLFLEFHEIDHAIDVPLTFTTEIPR